MTDATGSLPPPECDWALFLDFDGTLAEIAPSPQAVSVAPDVSSVLAAIAGALDGAVAIISGRPISELDALLSPFKAAAAGLHGLETRFFEGEIETRDVPEEALERVRDGLRRFALAHDGVELEDKGRALALHYRSAPELGGLCVEAMEQALSGSGDLHMLEGKMVVEAKPAFADKGTAIAALMDHAPFAGRRPVFAGDDVTDEDGFALVLKNGGLGIKVGPGATVASHRAASVASLLDWLRAIPAALQPGGQGSRGVDT